MAKDLIRYDLLAQEALRDVVRKVLADVAKVGILPGDHHFYVAFSTDYPGVRLSQRLREQYPGEMTIVLQHQFWDLGVTEHAFEVGLSFGGVPERLLVPFEAITQFFDPSANFGLKFEVVEPAAPAAAPAPVRAPLPTASTSEKVPRKAAPKGAGSEPATVPAAPASVPRVKAPAAEKGAKAQPPAAAEEPAPAEAPASRGAEVVSLDKFRKK